jgi:outer membrane biosynthesis protein TonB
MSKTFIARMAAAAGLVLAAAAGELGAQELFNQSELDTPVRPASQAVTARVLARSYPVELKRAGVTGSVQLEFVVDSLGRVELPTVKVIDFSSQELADAAKSVAGDLKFRPGKLKGRAVRSLVILPISYQ